MQNPTYFGSYWSIVRDCSVV